MSADRMFIFNFKVKMLGNWLQVNWKTRYIRIVVLRIDKDDKIFE